MAASEQIQRATLMAAVLGSGVTMLDESAIFVAVPAIERDLGFGLAGQQWLVNGYLLTLSSFLLLGGALGDLYGRRRLLLIGATVFGLSSLAAGLAPSAPILIGARLMEGVGAALLMPASLALLRSVYTGDERTAAIGSWAAWTGVASALGPLVAGALIDLLSWRWVLLANIPIAVAAALVAIWRVPESRDETIGPGDIDFVGALLAAVALGGISFALIQGKEVGWLEPAVLAGAGIGAVTLAAFLLWEVRREKPMLPLALFRRRNFSAANAATVALYGAFSGAFFVLMIYLQNILDYSALEAGAATLPMTVVFVAFSSRFGRLSAKSGPRLPMTVGQLMVAAALAYLAFLEPGDSYAAHVLPAMVLFGFGLAIAVPPLTDTAMSSAPEHAAGKASGVNNAAARFAGLAAIAALGLVYAASFRTAFPAPDDGRPQLARAAERVERNPTSALELGIPAPVRQELERPVEIASQTAYRNAIFTGALMALIGALLAFLAIRNPPDARPIHELLSRLLPGKSNHHGR